MKTRFNGVFEDRKKLWTQNMVPHSKVYGETLQTLDGVEYRNWNPFQSKLAAAIQKGLKFFPFEANTRVLYLGSAEGTTISHLSDVLAGSGLIIGIDVSARTAPKLIALSQKRPHIIAVIADARHPTEYPAELKDISFDVLYQDIAQKDQSEILIENLQLLKPDGFAFLVLKTPSIDSQKEPAVIVRAETQKLTPFLEILQVIDLEPFEKKHALIVGRKK